MASSASTVLSFEKLTAHDVAAIFAHVAADALSAADACALRGTCRLAVRGYDCAVHAGWVPIAGHRSGEPAEEGATCEWVWGWFPMRLCTGTPRAFVCPPRPPPAPVTLRFEHSLAAAAAAAADGAAGPSVRFPPAAVEEIFVCETLESLVAPPRSFARTPSLASAVVAVGGKAVQFHVAAAADRSGELELELSVGSLLLRVPARTTLRGFAWIAHGFGDRSRPSLAPPGDQFGTLTTLDTSRLTGVGRIGDRFMSNCRTLTSFDASGFASVRSIGHHFMDSVALSTFDSSGLGAVETIGSCALMDCSALTKIDASGLTALRALGDFFASNATALVSVDTSGLTSLACVGSGFLAGAKVLPSFDTAPLTSLTDAGKHFMTCCYGITTFDTRGLTALTRIGLGGLAKCTSLTTFDPSGLTALTTLGRHFLRSCPELAPLDLSGLAASNEAAAKLLAESDVVAKLGDLVAPSS